MIPGPRGVWTKKPVRAVEAAGMARDGILLSCCLDRLLGGRSIVVGVKDRETNKVKAEVVNLHPYSHRPKTCSTACTNIRPPS